MRGILALSGAVEGHFGLVILLISGLALLYPPGFVWIKPHIPKFLGVIMFAMGVTLRFSDFARIWRLRHVVAAGVAAQYIVMPALAVGISRLLGLPREATIGMIVVGACPGGTASNVMAFLAGADVALSVTLTLASTLLAPLLTPAMIFLLLAHRVDVSFEAMVGSVFWIVLFPLIDGLVLRHFFHRWLGRFLAVFPAVSIVFIALIVGCVLALNRPSILALPLLVGLAVVLHNGAGLVAGHLLGRVLRCSEKDTRTLAFEIGMQNSGLGLSLATQFFGAAAALPSAIFSLWHNLSGLALANWWRTRPVDAPLEVYGKTADPEP